jgi:hypothetical protein
LVLPIIAYTLSSTKVELRAKQFLPESEGIRRQRQRAGGKRRGWGLEGRNDPNIVYTINKFKKKRKIET